MVTEQMIEDNQRQAEEDLNRLEQKGARRTAFSVGRRYRCDATTTNPYRRDPVFDFVIIGPPKYDYNNPKRYKRCRLEVVVHGNGNRNLDENGKCCSFCSHGLEQDYSHKHLKKYGVLLP